MSSTLRLLTLISYISFQFSATNAAENWTGCVDKNKPDALLETNKETPVCFTIGPSGDWAIQTEFLRYAFKPVADEYSKLTLPGSYKKFVMDKEITFLDEDNTDKGITAHVSVQKKVSFLKMYREKTSGRIYPHLTIIVDVNEGVVEGMAWDDGCVFCSSDRCEQNTYSFNGDMYTDLPPTKACYLEKDECDDIVNKGGTECDLTLHVVWEGTDKNGKVLTSSNKRFSAFEPKQMKDQFTDALNKLTVDFDFLR